MKVILKSDVSKLGKAGSLIEVSDGHARNFLIPKGLAVEATAAKMSEWKAEQARKKRKDEADRRNALELKAKLDGKSITIEGKAGENGKLFGSITAAQIVDALASQHALNDFDKRNVKLDETVKSAGSYQFSLKLYPNVQADMTLVVTVSPQN